MRRSLFLLFACLLALGAGRAAAAPAPYDGEASRSSVLRLLPTLPFPLGFDLSTLGVSDAALATVGLVGAGTTSAGDGPNMRTVDDDGADCPNAAYTSIQAAVAASGPGDRVKVCPGVYPEQVTISSGQDGLVLFSQVPRAAVIKAPPVMMDPGDIVRVNGAQDVGIRHFTISGPLPDLLFCSLFVRTGVRVDGGGSATVWGNHITEIRSASPALRGCQNGIAVLAGRQFEGQTGSVELSHNLIDEYQKGGVLVDNAGSYGGIDHNDIVGPGPQPTIAPNGIQVSRGAAADLSHNAVSLNQYTLASFNGTAILLFQPGVGVVTVDHNDVFRNDDGISLFDTDGAEIGFNRPHDQTRFDGIFADADSRENVIEHNMAFDNAEHDCHDDSVGLRTAGTANFWMKNFGNTENRPGLCRTKPATL
jgi:hypothetical protein